VHTSASDRVLRFGPYSFDLDARELRKGGIKLRLKGQPLQILVCLLEEPGRTISRDELRNNLWPEGTFVDFEHSLNAAVNRLRERLHDSADSPWYIETVAGVGYRFMAPVERPEPETVALSLLASTQPEEFEPVRTRRSYRPWFTPLKLSGLALAVIAMSGGIAIWLFKEEPGVLTQVTP
jgi:cholera toxin transcriptional activator